MQKQITRENGWTLVELIVVLGIVAMLMALSLPSLLGIRRNSFDMQAKMELTNAARAAAAIEVEMDHYPADPMWLAASMPELDFSGTAARSIHVLTGAHDGLEDGQILLYSRSVTGTWFGIRLVRDGEGAGRHSCKGVIADMTFETCEGAAW